LLRTALSELTPMHDSNTPRLLRRRLLLGMAAAPLLARAPLARAAFEAPRALDFLHTHTDEKLSVVYFDNGAYVPDALRAVDKLLRDFRTGESHPIDAQLLDILHTLRTAAVGVTRHVHETAKTHADQVRGVVGGVGPGLAKWCDGDHDQRWIDRS